MNSGSIRLRLLVLSAATIALALALTWVVLSVLFERHVRARVDVELANQIVWIAANLSAKDGQVTLVADPPDPRYLRPLGGYYWQVDAEERQPLRSRSLWDETLPETPPPSDEKVHYEAQGPEGRRLFIRHETLRIPAGDGERTVDVKVAADYAEISGPLASFRRDMTAALSIIGLCLIGAATLQVSVGLAPLATVRRAITEIRAGLQARLNPSVPREVRPLVEEINQLLEAQEEGLKRARIGASDLAHALKTPLAVLASIAGSLTRAGMIERAGEIVAQVDTMSRRVDRELARARLNPDGVATTMLGTLVARLVTLMRKTPQGAALTWELFLSPDLLVAADEVDVAELVGNLLDNASKWARAQVILTMQQESGFARLRIADDGPGVAEAQLPEILTRGARLDDAKSGSGLGLAIAHDIVSAYRGSICLSRSQRLGGLQVEVTLPIAKRPAMR